MLLLATKGVAKEQWAVVLRQVDQPYDNTITSVFLDRIDMEDGIPDTRLGPLGTNMSLIAMVLKDLLQRGVEISFDDSGSSRSGGMEYIEPGNLLTVDGKDILDLFPNLAYAFPFAARKRAAAQQSQQVGR